MIERTLQGSIERASKTFPAILVTGPRQSGKTTLLRNRFAENARYVSLENPDVRSRAISDPIGFFKMNPPPLILDEIQYAPDLLFYVKSAIDDDRTPGHWLLTGSQSFSLMEGVSESLAGRVAVLELLPLSAAEAAGVPDRDSTPDDILSRVFAASDSPGVAAPPASLGDWLLRGAYPEPRANLEVDRDLWCSSYVQTYLERDVRQSVNVGDLNAFDRFLRLAAARTGQILNMTELARDTGISAPTAKQWLSVLEASGLVYLLQPYFKNFGKRLMKRPKLYFLDTALASFLTGLHAVEPLLQGPSARALVETAVVSAWVKAFRHRGLPAPLFFWRSSDGIEVDILVDRNATLYAIEVKATSTVTSRHASSLLRFRELAGKPDAPAVVVADVDEPLSVAPGVRAVPWWIV